MVKSLLNKRFPIDVSIIMPVYNGGCYLEEAIDSILNQTFKNFELIIIDDGSTDKTPLFVKKYSDQNSRIILMKNESQLGVVKSLNKGIENSRGKYIARMDSNDISLLECLARQVAYLNYNPETVMVSCNLKVVDERGNLILYLRRSSRDYLVCWHLLFRNYISAHSQVMFRREAALNAEGYRESDLHVEDYGLWSRLMEVGKIVILPEILHIHRYHKKSISGEDHLIQKEMALELSRENAVEDRGGCFDGYCMAG